MTDTKISDFTDGGLVQTTDEIAAVRGGSNVKVFFGSAAAVDVGTGTGEVPTIDQITGLLGSAAYANIGVVDGGIPQFTQDSTSAVFYPAADGSLIENVLIPVSATDLQSDYLENKITAGSNVSINKLTDSQGVEVLEITAAGSGGISDGTYGDIVVSSGGTDWQVKPDVITAKTSAGMIIEANNGTDVVDFGIGNTANSTFYGNVSMNTTNKIVNMADPTSDQDAATKKYVDDEIAAIPTPSTDYELLSVLTPSGAATVNITLTSGYSSFTIVVDNLIPSTDDRGLRAFYSVDGGSNYISGANDYGWRMQTFGPSTSATTSAGMAINTEFIQTTSYSNGLGIFGATAAISSGLGNAADEGCSFIMNIVRGGNRQNFAQWAGTARNISTYPLTFRGEGTLVDTTAPITNVQFALSSGNITATIYVYGRKNS